MTNLPTQSCQADLIKEGGFKYFIQILADQSMNYEYRTMAAFVLSVVVKDNLRGQEAAQQSNVISLCLSQLEEPNALLKQWLAICLGRLWSHYEAARWCGVRDSAHEKLYSLLWHEIPDVRELCGVSVYVVCECVWCVSVYGVSVCVA